MRTNRKRKKTFNRFKLVIPIVFVLAVMWVWKSNEADKLSRRLTELERTKKNIIEQHKLLHIELEKYRSIGWIDRCARQNYRMTYNVKKRIVLFDRPNEVQKQNRSLFASMGGFIGRIYRSLIE